MSTHLTPRAKPVLTRPAIRPGSQSPSAPVSPSPARGFQVLQSRGAPAQLSLFLRPGAVDVK
jgi:hypothetical protein